MPRRRPSLQQLIHDRQQNEFVGRGEELTTFRRNLAAQPGERIFVFNVSGQGGVGKTTLLGKYRDLVRSVNGVTALVNDDQPDVVAVLEQIGRQLAEQGLDVKVVQERLRTYHQHRQQLEADPDAPQGFAAFLARTLTKGGLKLARGIPIGGELFDLVDSDALATKAGDWASYVARKLRNNVDDIALVQRPAEVLTPLLFEVFDSVPEDRPITLFFDTYERTSTTLDGWLRDVLNGAFGATPEFLLVIAGRDELDRNRWAPLAPVIARFTLEPFTDEEARDYLAQKQITDERVVEVILRLSGRLPLLVAMLASEKPSDPGTIDDRSSDAVERFLQWTENPDQRQAALVAALPRRFNRDLLALLVESEQADAHFDWLVRQPFVEERADGWVYHQVVREQMLRYSRRRSEVEWSRLQQILAAYYEQKLGQVDITRRDNWRDSQVLRDITERVYHMVLAAPQNLASACDIVLTASQYDRFSTALKLAHMVAEAGRDASDSTVEQWGTRLASAIESYRANQWQQAARDWAALMQAPFVTSSLRAMFICLQLYAEVQRTGQTEAFRERLNRALPEFPALPVALRLRASLHMQVGDYTGALPLLTQIVERETDHVDVLARYGDVYRMLGRYDDALAYLNRALEHQPEDVFALAVRSDVYRMLGRYDDALVDLNRALDIQPDNAFALRSRGAVCRVLGRYDEALADLSHALDIQPDNAFALRSRGAVYRVLGRYDEALADLSHALELRPDDAFTLRSRGEIYRILRHYDEALTDLSHALEREPDSVMALARRGDVYRMLGRYDEALTDLSRTLEREPDSVMALAVRGAIYRMLGRYDEALTDLSRALEHAPDDAFSLARRGAVYRVLGRYDDAMADLNRAVALKPEDSWNYYSRALLYLTTSRKAEAEADFVAAKTAAEKTLSNEPQHWNERFNLALYLLADGRFKEATERYCAVLDEQPLRHRVSAAIENLTEYLRLFPDNKLAREMQQMLQAHLAATASQSA